MNGNESSTIFRAIVWAMSKRRFDLQKKRQLARDRTFAPTDSIAGLVAGSGAVRYSPAAGRFMAKEPVKQINPASKEGREIAKRILQSLDRK